MQVDPLAGDSLGVRSSAVTVTRDDVMLLIDPGVAISMRPGGRPPHPIEFEALQSAAGRIDAAATTADAVLVSHYHYDHFVPLRPSRLLWATPERSRHVFGGKHVFVKDPTAHINQHQKDRADALRPVFDGVAAGLTHADGEVRELGPFTLRFSPPVPHGGAGSDLGWVIMLAIEGPDETFVYTSDVQGPVELETTNWILEQEPDLVLVDGPSLSSGRSGTDELVAARATLRRLAEHADLIIDHHPYRRADPTAFLRPIETAAADAGHTVDSVASYRGDPGAELEIDRAWNHERFPVDPSFYAGMERGQFDDELIDWRDWVATASEAGPFA